MPLPKHRDLGDPFRLTPAGTIEALNITGRPPTPAETKRRYRAGHRATKGHIDPVWIPARNGLPFRPYVYRGTGADAYTGEIVQ